MSLPPLPEEAPDRIAPLDAAAASPLPAGPPLPVPSDVEPVPPSAAHAVTDAPETLPSEPLSPLEGQADVALEGPAVADALGPDATAPEVPVTEGPAAAGPASEAPQAAGTVPAAAVATTPWWNGWWDEFMAWVRVFTSAAVYATLIVTFLFQVARVDGQSMAPTLEDRDRLIVNKLAYRLGEPQRGDIVMLYYPLDPDKSYVKRVIAEEGDMVRVVEGQVFVNDVPLADDQIPPEYRSHDDWGPQVIPEGYYFVMGDHRNNSSDSRHWGFVPKKYIIGRVQVRWWPIPTATIF